MKKVLSGEHEQEKGKKPVKAQDLARLYETIIQVRWNCFFFTKFSLIPRFNSNELRFLENVFHLRFLKVKC